MDTVYGGYSYASSSCHGVKHVLTINKCKIYAGGCNAVADKLNKIRPVLTISLAGANADNTISRDNSPAMTEKAQKILKRTIVADSGSYVPDARMIIDWQDMNAPGFPLSWWEALYDDLSEIDGNVAIFCQGGHGRTGTALAVLFHLSGVANGEDVVEFLRKSYCEEAVETQKQIDYLTSFGVKTKAGLPKKTIEIYQSNKLDDNHKTRGKCDTCNKKNSLYDEDHKKILCNACWQKEEEEAVKKDAKTDKKTICSMCQRDGRWVPSAQSYLCEACLPKYHEYYD